MLCRKSTEDSSSRLRGCLYYSHPADIELFQAEPKWWADRQTGVGIRRLENGSKYRDKNCHKHLSAEEKHVACTPMWAHTKKDTGFLLSHWEPSFYCSNACEQCVSATWSLNTLSALPPVLLHPPTLCCFLFAPLLPLFLPSPPYITLRTVFKREIVTVGIWKIYQ